MSETNILNFVLNILPIQNEEQSVVYCKGRHLKRWQTSRLKEYLSILSTI